jgi:hypothetical protein
MDQHSLGDLERIVQSQQHKARVAELDRLLDDMDTSRLQFKAYGGKGRQDAFDTAYKRYETQKLEVLRVELAATLCKLLSDKVKADTDSEGRLHWSDNDLRAIAREFTGIMNKLFGVDGIGREGLDFEGK